MIIKAYVKYGYTMSELADFLKINQSSVSKICAKQPLDKDVQRGLDLF